MKHVIIIENSLSDYQRYREPLTKLDTCFSYDKIIFVSIFSVQSWWKLFRCKAKIFHIYRLNNILVAYLLSVFTSSTIVFHITGFGRLYDGKKYKRNYLIIFLLRRIASNGCIVCQNEVDSAFLGENKIKSRVISGSGAIIPTISNTKVPAKSIVEIRFVYLGRLTHMKGLTELVSFFAVNKDLQLNIYGSFARKSYKRKILEIIESSKNINFHGESSRPDEVFRAMDILILNSYYGEGLPRVILEAVANGCWVLAKKNPGTAHLSNIATIYDILTRDKLVDELCRITEKNKEIRLKRLIDTFSQDVIYNEILSLYRELID